jgi:hypothetical protein
MHLAMSIAHNDEFPGVPLQIVGCCWIPILTDLAPSLVASSLVSILRITNQSSVNLNFVKRVSTLFHLLTISTQLIVRLPLTKLLGLRTPITFRIMVEVCAGALVRAGTRTSVFHRGRTVRELLDPLKLQYMKISPPKLL